MYNSSRKMNDIGDDYSRTETWHTLRSPVKRSDKKDHFRQANQTRETSRLQPKVDRSASNRDQSALLNGVLIMASLRQKLTHEIVVIAADRLRGATLSSNSENLHGDFRLEYAEEDD